MSEKLAEGRVVEARPDLLMLAPGAGTAVETAWVVEAHEAQPGDRVVIWKGGIVEIVGRPETRPDVLVPGHPNLA